MSNREKLFYYETYFRRTVKSNGRFATAYVILSISMNTKNLAKLEMTQINALL